MAKEARKEYYYRIVGSLYPQEIEKLRELAFLERTSMAELCRNAIDRFIQDLERGLVEVEREELSEHLAQFTYYLTMQQIEQLDKISKKLNISRSSLIRQAIRYTLKMEEGEEK